MHITTKSVIKHAGLIFEEGKTYDVPDALGHYFIANGWALGPDGESLDLPTMEHVIEVDNGKHGHATKEK